MKRTKMSRGESYPQGWVDVTVHVAPDGKTLHYDGPEDAIKEIQRRLHRQGEEKLLRQLSDAGIGIAD